MVKVSYYPTSTGNYYKIEYENLIGYLYLDGKITIDSSFLEYIDEEDIISIRELYKFMKEFRICIYAASCLPDDRINMMEKAVERT